MNYNVKIFIIGLIRFLWICFSILIWVMFFDMFLKDKTFDMWFFWGFACGMCMIPTAIGYIIHSAKEGYQEGKNSYVGNFYTNWYGGIGVSIKDKRYSQAILSMVLSILVFILCGPVLLPIKIILAIIDVVRTICELYKDKTFGIKALKITGIVLLILIVIIGIIAIVDLFV